MSRTLLPAAIALALSAAAPSGHAQELRIGFLNSKTGWAASIGRDLENGWKLGLEHLGWTKDGDKLGGVPMRVFWGDDQSGKVDIALKEVEKFLKQEKAQIVTGIIWTNVLLAIRVPVFDVKSMLLTSTAGTTAFAGEMCNPLFVSTSFVADLGAEATGDMANKDGIKTVVVMAPNYQGGKDYISGFTRTYKGKIVETILFKFGEADFQADISKIRAAKPEGLYIFAPGAMGIAFVKQWAASGLAKEVKLISQNTVDELSLAAIGDAAIGSTHTGHWNPDLDVPKNKDFVKAYKAKFGIDPSYIAVQSYDSAAAIDRGVRETGGKLNDMAAVARAIRKGTIESPRGTLKFNVNGMLVQPYWRLTVVRGADGKPVIRGGEKIMERPDSHWQQCPPNMRI